MAPRSPLPASRYRRRILGLGVLATGALYAIGAPIFNARVESDLEERVPAELADVGYLGITASFSGQDGTLTCATPLDDPEAARAAAYDVYGVRAIELARSCRVNTEPTPTPATTVPEPTGDEATGAEPTAESEASAATVPPSTAPSTDAEAELATVVDIVAANPDLAFLSVLLEQVDLLVDDEQDMTLFAPSNDAFNAVPADLLAQLQDDGELLARVLRHHAVAGVVSSADLVDGELDALDGTGLTVSTGGSPTVGGATITTSDIAASNGVVHVIDRVLLPDDVTTADVVPAPAAATFEDAAMVLTGVVASEVERQTVVDAAAAAVGAAFVTDELAVDPDTGVDAATADRLVTLIAAMPANLASGEVGFDGSEMYANGIFLDAAGRDDFAAAAAGVDVEAALEPAPDATDEDAALLEDELNEFVAANPILFESASDVLTNASFAIIDRIALDAQQFAGIAITIEGHTDTDGTPAVNLQLSQDRADAVRDALIERGLDGDAIEATGFGSEQPVIIDGVEDKAASRRVEFRVVAAP